MPHRNRPPQEDKTRRWDFFRGATPAPIAVFGPPGFEVLALGLAVGGAVLVMTLLQGAQAQSEEGPSPFIGFWEAIDRLDGGRTVRSITPLEDGSFQILAASEYFSTCEASDGLGTLVATGIIEDDVLVAENTRIECANGDVFDGLPDEYRYDPATDLLTHERVGHGRPDFVLHRLSHRRMAS